MTFKDAPISSPWVACTVSATICLLAMPLVWASDPLILGERGPGPGEVTF
jgi:hypothetical protein